MKLQPLIFISQREVDPRVACCSWSIVSYVVKRYRAWACWFFRFPQCWVGWNSTYPWNAMFKPHSLTHCLRLPVAHIIHKRSGSQCWSFLQSLVEKAHQHKPHATAQNRGYDAICNSSWIGQLWSDGLLEDLRCGRYPDSRTWFNHHCQLTQLVSKSKVDLYSI